jgi:hypothetical protein
VRRLKRLITLDLECMPSITDAGVEMLEFPALEILSVQGCAQLSAACLSTLKERCPRLHLLNLYRCPNITPDQVRQLAQSIDRVLQYFK